MKQKAICVEHGLLEYSIIKPNVYLIETCVVEENFRGQGIATKLIKKFIEKYEGYIYADIHKADTITIKIFKDLGFSKIGVSKRYENCYEYLLINKKPEEKSTRLRPSSPDFDGQGK